jgi:hypothetical protein
MPIFNDKISDFRLFCAIIYDKISEIAVFVVPFLLKKTIIWFAFNDIVYLCERFGSPGRQIILLKRYAYLEIWECRSFQKATSNHSGFHACYAWTAIPQSCFRYPTTSNF